MFIPRNAILKQLEEIRQIAILTPPTILFIATGCSGLRSFRISLEFRLLLALHWNQIRFQKENWVITTIVVRPLVGCTSCARSVFNHLGALAKDIQLFTASPHSQKMCFQMCFIDFLFCPITSICLPSCVRSSVTK